MLSPRDWSDLVSVAESVLTDRCDVERPTLTRGQGLDRTATYDVVAADVPCAFRPSGAQPSEEHVAGRLLGRLYSAVYLPRGTDVRSGDRIAVNGMTLEVSGPPVAGTYDPLLAVPVIVR